MSPVRTLSLTIRRACRTMTVIHSENILLENIYINSTDGEHAVGFDFSSLNVRSLSPTASPENEALTTLAD